MKLNIILLILTLLGLVESKVSKCRHLLNSETDFFYCTKFSVGKGKAFKSDLTAKFNRNVKFTVKKNA